MHTFLVCRRCTACCRWVGQVRVTAGEIARMAAHLGLAETAFIQRYTRLTHDRSGLALEERPTHECIFLEGHECRVQPVKPQQCRDFPNLWNFPGSNRLCQAQPRLVNDAEYKALIREATSREV